MKKIVILTGAGISAESGIQTFRGAGGLWNGYNVMEVASPEGWAKNPALVLNFYNLRRADAAKAKPNQAHIALSKLEKKFNTLIITQNIDNLHEQGGSSHIMHLHGKLSEVKSVANDNIVYDIGDKPIQLGDTAEDGQQLRPNVVWFGEMVPMIAAAIEETATADIFIIIGTSLAVYPAASLLHYVPSSTPVYLIDPNEPDIYNPPTNFSFIQQKATEGVPMLVNKLLNKRPI